MEFNITPENIYITLVYVGALACFVFCVFTWYKAGFDRWGDLDGWGVLCVISTILCLVIIGFEMYALRNGNWLFGVP